jgi:hypothetical protein
MRRKAVGLFLTLCLVFTAFSSAYAATSVSDVKGHWAESQINDWTAKGLIAGYPDGSFKPDNSITRAEFIALVNRSFGFTAMDTVSFSDLNASDWEYADVQKAVKAGFITGYEDQTLRPNNQISRQEIASIVLRLLNLSPNEDGTSIFTDAATFPSWSKGAIGAVAAATIMKGYEDSSFRPTRSTTRAEAVITLIGALKAAAVVYDQAGTYGPTTGTTTVNGSVEVKVPGVVLQNMVINGNLILSAGIGTGDVTLKNVTVKGTTIVNGGGANSIHAVDSTLAKVVVNKVDQTPVRIVAEGTTSVDDVLVQSPVTLEESNLTGVGFTNVTLDAGLPAGSKVTLIGSFNELTILAKNISIELTGSVQKITVGANATGVTLKLGQGTTVVSLILDAPIVVTGPGTIQTVTEHVPGSTYETQPVTIVTGSPTPTPAPGGTGGSGGGSGGSGGSGGNGGGGQTQTGTVTGFVYGSGNTPQKDATVSVTGTTYLAFTGPDGAFRIDNVPSWSTLTVTQSAYQTLTTSSYPTATGINTPVGPIHLTPNVLLQSATVTSNTYMDVTVSQGVYGNALHTQPVDVTSFHLAISGGSATAPAILDVTKVDNSPLSATGGDTTIRIYFTVNGTPNGSERLILTPASSASIYGDSGTPAASANETLIAGLHRLS